MGEEWISSSVAGIPAATDPLFVALALRFDAEERTGGRRVVGLFIGVAASSPFSVSMSRAMRTLVALGVVNTGAGFWLFYTLIAEAAARRASVITYVMPAVAVVLAILVLSESFTVATALGLALILGGTALSTASERRGTRRRRRGLVASQGIGQRTEALGDLLPAQGLPLLDLEYVHGATLIVVASRAPGCPSADPGGGCHSACVDVSQVGAWSRSRLRLGVAAAAEQELADLAGDGDGETGADADERSGSRRRRRGTRASTPRSGWHRSLSTPRRRLTEHVL